MDKTKSLEDLLIEELDDIHSGEERHMNTVSLKENTLILDSGFSDKYDETGKFFSPTEPVKK